MPENSDIIRQAFCPPVMVPPTQASDQADHDGNRRTILRLLGPSRELLSLTVFNPLVDCALRFGPLLHEPLFQVGPGLRDDLLHGFTFVAYLVELLLQGMPGCPNVSLKEPLNNVP